MLPAALLWLWVNTRIRNRNTGKTVGERGVGCSIARWHLMSASGSSKELVRTCGSVRSAGSLLCRGIESWHEDIPAPRISRNSWDPGWSLLSQSLDCWPSCYQNGDFFAVEAEAHAAPCCHIVHLLFTAERGCAGTAAGAGWGEDGGVSCPAELGVSRRLRCREQNSRCLFPVGVSGANKYWRKRGDERAVSKQKLRVLRVCVCVPPHMWWRFSVVVKYFFICHFLLPKICYR